jgi:hypothetical protein
MLSCSSEMRHSYTLWHGSACQAGLLVPMQHRVQCQGVTVHTLAVRIAEKGNASAWQTVAAELALSWQVGIHPPVGAVSTQGGLAREAHARC